MISSTILYLIVKRRVGTVQTVNHYQNNSNRITKSISIIFFISMFFILIRYHSISNYTRPMWLIGELVFLTGLVSIQILLKNNKSFKIIIIIESLSLGLFCILSQSLLFTTTVGTDSWWHINFIERIFQNGHVPMIEEYSGTPLYHIFIYYCMDILNISFKSSINLTIVPAFLITTSLSLMAISNKLFNEMTALLTILLFNVSSYTIMFGLIAIPNTVGMIIIATVALLIFNLIDSVWKRITLLFIMSAIILYHSVSSMILLFILLAVTIFDNVLIKQINDFQLKIYNITNNILLIFSVMMIGWWLYMTTFIDYLTLQMLTGFSFNDSFSASNIITQYSLSINPLEIIFNEAARTIPLSLSFIGILFIIGSRTDAFKITRMRFALSAAVPIIIAFITTIAGMIIIQSRWWFVGLTMLLPIIAYAIIKISETTKRKYHIIVLLTVVLTLLSLFNPMACIDNPIFSKDTGFTDAYKMSEMNAADFVLEHRETQVLTTDEYFSKSVFIDHKALTSEQASYFSETILKGSNIEAHRLYIFRSRVVDGTFIAQREPFRFGFDVDVWFHENNANKIYCNEGVSIFESY